uniref:Amino acid permease/ SLC12A domain-containing protein n=1 Tax=Oryza brachyantha TaxID=4533 RepID=J3LC39_ORYBR
MPVLVRPSRPLGRHPSSRSPGAPAPRSTALPIDKLHVSRTLSNFAFSFANILMLTGVTVTYNTGLRYGGPVSMSLGWLLVALFNGCVALSMAAICSAYPTSGGLYYWSAKLAGKE